MFDRRLKNIPIHTHVVLCFIASNLVVGNGSLAFYVKSDLAQFTNNVMSPFSNPFLP